MAHKTLLFQVKDFNISKSSCHLFDIISMSSVGLVLLFFQKQKGKQNDEIVPCKLGNKLIVCWNKIIMCDGFLWQNLATTTLEKQVL